MTKTEVSEDETLDKEVVVETEEEDEAAPVVDKESEEDDESQDDDESEEDDEEPETEEDEPEFQKRFTQFKGDTYEEYVPELEKAHANLIGEISRLKSSSTENQKKLDAVLAAASKDPELAKKLNEVMGDEAKEITTDPAILHARKQLEAQMDKEYKQFADLHPEIESDEILAKEVFEVVAELGSIARKRGEVLPMFKTLQKALAIVRPNDGKEEIASKAKEIAAKTKTGKTVKKIDKKSKFTEEQIKYAQKFGLTPEQLAAAN